MLEILAKVGFDWQVALANLVGFLLIFLLLKKYAFGPIGKAISERKKFIDKGIQHTQDMEIKLKEADDQVEQAKADGVKKAHEMLSESRSKGEVLIGEAKSQAEIERIAILAKASSDAENLKESMQKELSKETIGLVLSATEKILKKEMNESSNEEYCKEVLDSITI
ncbi:MAG: F-type H+-transporting ATPase subunit b [Flavobacteriaceae bacterium]|jgi:F-type H+-transporting ATPase subunit b